MQDYLKATEYQKKSLSILKNILSSEDVRIKDAETLLEKIIKTMEDRVSLSHGKSDEIKASSEKPKILKKSKGTEMEEDGFEEYERSDDVIRLKVIIKVKLKLILQEKERLLQRIKIASLNAKYGFQKLENIDYIRFIHKKLQRNEENEFI